jgi:hypothetical protein
MTVVREAIDRFLSAHEPYPALVIDRYHELISANDALGLVLDGVAPELLVPPVNGLRVALHPRGMAARTLNLPQWSAHLLARLRRETLLTGDPRLAELYDELATYPGVSTLPAVSPPEILVPLRLRDTDGGAELAFFGTVTTFGSATDVELSELAIEAFYPANAATAMRLLREIGAGEL